MSIDNRMQAVYQRDYYLRAADFDWCSRLTPAAILDLFQDIAGVHARTLGCGTVHHEDAELLWVLVRTKLRILAQPSMYDKVRVKTWPLKPSAIRFQREYMICDEADRPLVLGSSEWVLMHPVSRRAVPVKDVYPTQLELCTQRCFEGRFTRVPDFKPIGDGWAVQPRLSDVDLNGHINNTKYANFVIDALELDRGECIGTMQLDYHREVRRGAALTVHAQRQGSILLAKGMGEGEETMFSCMIELADALGGNG